MSRSAKSMFLKRLLQEKPVSSEHATKKVKLLTGDVIGHSVYSFTLGNFFENKFIR